MALNATTVWEVQGTAGNDANGGGFDASVAGGTDYSLTGTPHVTIDGTVINATIQATTTQLKLAGTSTYTVATTDVGNIVNINGGTMTAGRYRIQSVITGASNTWVLDRSGGTAGQTGTGRMGGCLVTIQTAITAVTVNGMVIYVKADGTYALTLALSIVGPTSAANYATRLIGYTTSRTDNGQVTITVGAGAGVNGITLATNAIGWSIENFIIDGAVTTGSQGLIGIQVGGSTNHRIVNCKIMNFANEGIKGTVNVAFRMFFTEVTGCAGTTASVDSGGNASFLGMWGCYIHDNTKSGLNCLLASPYIIDSIIANNTGATSDGVVMSNGTYVTVDHCLFYGNGRDGIRLGAGSPSSMAFSIITNSIFAKNGGLGLNEPTATSASSTVQPSIDYNGYWSNSGGSIANITQGAHDVVISGTDPTNDPFVAKASHDWRLNNVAGAGALLRGAGFSGAFVGLSSVHGYVDIGPYQHQFPSSIVIVNE